MTNNEEANAKDDLASSSLSRIKELGLGFREPRRIIMNCEKFSYCIDGFVPTSTSP